MAGLAPFEPSPRLAIGVSGGADSLALVLLADEWTRRRGGSVLALIVDHGLRPEAAAEAAETASRLAERGIGARILRVEGLARGPALAERAREARFRVLADACAAEGILHLLLGHHAGDQAETVLIRSLGGSGAAGLAGIAPMVETAGLRILRPLLAVPPAFLRAMLQSIGVDWVEDPSNADRAALRPRLRQLRHDGAGVGSATTALVAAASEAAGRRAEHESKVAAELAEHASLCPEGFALLDGPVSAAALAALVQTIAGAPFPPPTQSIARLAPALAPATLAGVRFLRAGRLGPGWLVVREANAMAAPVAARPEAVWDGRFRLGAEFLAPAGATLGPVGADAARLRRVSSLPAAVLRTLPAIRVGSVLFAVPHLLYPDRKACEGIPVVFAPPRPAAAAAYRFGDASWVETPYVD